MRIFVPPRTLGPLRQPARQERIRFRPHLPPPGLRIKATIEKQQADGARAMRQKTGKAKEILAFEGETAQEAADTRHELKRLRSKRSGLQGEIAAIQKLDSSSKVIQLGKGKETLLDGEKE